MDIGQLEAFVQVAFHHNFSKAADALYLTQPSVTARIQALEKELGEELFERTGRGVRQTDAGQAFLPHAERILQVLREGKESIEAVHNAQLGSLRLGSALTISTYVLPRLLKIFRSRYPAVDVTVRTGRSEQVLSMLLRDEVQVGIVRSLHHQDIRTVHLYDDQIVLVTNPGHPFASRGRVAIEELAEQPLIMFDRGSSYYSLITNVFRRAEVVPHLAMELDSMESTKKMVEEGLGIALLPRLSAERELQLGILTEIELVNAPPVSRQIALIYRKNRRLGRALEAFIDLLGEVYSVAVPVT